MKYKDLDNGKIFTWYADNKHFFGVKIGGEAIRLSDMAPVSIHANRKVREPEQLPEDVLVKFGRNGAVYLITPYSSETVYARRVIVVATEIMHKESFSPRKIGGSGGKEQQVYITLDLLEKKIRDLETLARMVKVLIETNMSVGSSNNEIMLTSKPETISSLE